MKVGSSFEACAAEFYFSGSSSVVSPVAGAGGALTAQCVQRGSRTITRQAGYVRQQTGADGYEVMKVLPKPLPMSPAYQNATSLQERFQMEPKQSFENQALTMQGPIGTSTASRMPASQLREQTVRETQREVGLQKELSSYRGQQGRGTPETTQRLADLPDSEAQWSRQSVPEALPISKLAYARNARTPERTTFRNHEERSSERHSTSTRAVSSNARTRSIDASTRSLSGRMSGSHGTSSTGFQNGRRSAPVVKQDSLEDDTAEYSDRFLPGYDKIRLLGRGACAVVWLAQPTGQKGYVAIKQVAKGNTGKKRSDCESARKEIFFGSYLFHPGGEPKLPPVRYPGIRNVAKLLDHSETKRDIWMVMEYGGLSLTKSAYEIKGEFLRGERLYRVAHLPLLQSMKRDPAVLKGLLRQLLSALCVLAEHHIVHSDIKPDNILIEDDDQLGLRCRFIDLGSAFTFDCPEQLSLATPEYMPPEALETCASRSSAGPGRISLSSRLAGGSGNRNRQAAPDPVTKLHRNSQPWSFDMWSLGSILLELCLGTPLWLSYKCRVADDQRANSAAMGLFAVPGRDPGKIIAKQLDALCKRGVHNVVRGAQGVPLHNGDVGSGLELLSMMLAWDPLERISPSEALDHPWLQV